MQVLPIGKRFRVVIEDAGENEAGSTTFEEQTTDATGKKKWDACQRVERGNIVLPFLLVVELVRVLEAEAQRERQHKLMVEERTERVIEKVRAMS